MRRQSCSSNGGNIFGVDKRAPALPGRCTDNPFGLDGLGPSQQVGHETSWLDEGEGYPAGTDSSLAQFMPRADGETVLNIHRRKFHQVAHARGLGRLCGQLVLNGNLRTGVDQEKRIDSFKGRVQACGLCEITGEDLNTIAKERARLL